MPWSAELRDLQARLSATQVEFLDFVARNPEGLGPEGFAALGRLDEFLRYPLQPWPLFLSQARRREMSAAARGLYDLIRSIPQRVFGNDPERLAGFYGIGLRAARRASAAIEATAGARGLLARGDFIDTPDGFKCIELNVESNLGGWGNATWADRYRQVPLIQRFLEETGVRPSCTDTIRVFFRNVLEQARRAALDADDELNVVFLLGEPAIPTWLAYVQEAFDRARLEAGGPSRGEIVVCDLSELAPGPLGLSRQGRRMHVVIELFVDEVPEVLVQAQLSGRTQVYNGPANRVLTDKANLAILSEIQDSDLVSAEERELIRAHVPWTRRITAGFADRGGERVYLPDYLLEERERLVLKRGDSLQGRHVRVGQFSSPAEWEAGVEQALDEGLWIVQEKLEHVPYLFQAPGGGAAPHDVVWGLFVFGDHYGGGFTRLIPRGASGVINAARGALEGVLFEVP